MWNFVIHLYFHFCHPKFQGTLVCYRRKDMESVPGCSGAGGPADLASRDYCCNRPYNYLFLIGGDAVGLGLCEGDCDADEDCDGNLICFQRSGWTEVPGCLGEGRRGYDYCRLPDPSPTVAPTVSTQPTPTSSTQPSFEPSQSSSPSALQSDTPSLSPTSSSKPSHTPTESQTLLPTYLPSMAPSDGYYTYVQDGTSCELDNQRNWQGPAPFSDKSNVIVQFFAFGE